MSKVMEELFEYASDQYRYSKRLSKSWDKIDKVVERLVTSEDREEMDVAISDHSSEMRYGGFKDGFRIATEIWKSIL